MGKIVKQSPRPQSAFTRIELAAILACIVLLGLITLPLLGRPRSAASEAVCMNNLRNLGRCFLMYAEQNNGYVPEEGNATSTIINNANQYAWYNAAVQPDYPTMKSLYISNNAATFPVPTSSSIYSCPNAVLPFRPTLGWAFFMYGENNWLCVNSSTRASLGQTVQPRFATIPKPSATIMIGENLDISLSVPSMSGVTAPYVAARHENFALFTMCDGSVRVMRTNDFLHSTASAAKEWYVNGTNADNGLNQWPCYWWPTPTTPQ